MIPPRPMKDGEPDFLFELRSYHELDEDGKEIGDRIYYWVEDNNKERIAMRKSHYEKARICGLTLKRQM